MSWLIMRLYSDQVLLNPNLSTAQKIEKIKEAFKQASEVRFDEESGIFYEANLDHFLNPKYKQEYLEKTKGLAVNMGGNHGFTLLGVAAQNGELGVMKWLVEEQGANINLGNDLGHSPLLMATENGQIVAMRYLISKGADLNFAVIHDSGDTTTGGTSVGETPLHKAMRFGQVEALKVLLENGALLKKAGPFKPFNPIEYGYYLLPIISDYEKGIEHPHADALGYILHRDKTKIPSQTKIKTMLKLLEAYHKHQAFIRSTLSSSADKNKEKEVKGNKEADTVSLSLLTEKDNEVTTTHSNVLTEEDNKAALEFNRLIQATHKVIGKLQRQTQITTDCEIRILSFLYGDLEKHQAVSERIAAIVDPEEVDFDLAGKAGKHVVSI